MAKSKAAALKALELDPELAEAHSALGLVRIFEWDWSGAEQELRKAIELNPNFVWAHWILGVELAYLGRVQEGIAAMERAQDLDPLAVPPFALDPPILYTLMGDDRKAVRRWQTALELDPTAVGALQNLGSHHCQRGRFEDGLALLERARTLSPDDPLITADVAWCHAAAGRHGEAQELLEEIEAQARRQYVDPTSRALVHVGLGQADAAFASLEEAYRLSAHRLPDITIDARYDPLRSDPRFQDLLRRLGLAPEAPRGRI